MPYLNQKFYLGRSWASHFPQDLHPSIVVMEILAKVGGLLLWTVEIRWMTDTGDFRTKRPMRIYWVVEHELKTRESSLDLDVSYGTAQGLSSWKEPVVVVQRETDE